VGVFVGCMFLDYSDALSKHGVAGGAYAVTGNGLSFLAGRIAYTFGFHGPCVPTNTGAPHAK
jgi:acyl transferase domain-containing protein